MKGIDTYSTVYYMLKWLIHVEFGFLLAMIYDIVPMGGVDEKIKRMLITVVDRDEYFHVSLLMLFHYSNGISSHRQIY